MSSWQARSSRSILVCLGHGPIPTLFGRCSATLDLAHQPAVPTRFPGFRQPYCSLSDILVSLLRPTGACQPGRFPSPSYWPSTQVVSQAPVTGQMLMLPSLADVQGSHCDEPHTA